jgi:hypothetical protein
MAYEINIAISIGITLDKIAARLGIPDVPVIICTDSFSFYECFVKFGTTKKKRLIINIMALRQTYEHQKIFDVRWINGDSNSADAITKNGPNKALKQLVTSNSLTMKLQGWVKRDRLKKDSD